ncbi:MAG: AMP-binding protein [Pseudomonadota bacterium]|nr:AMP-binding protein [Pseudomonadota bacterium]
MPSPAPRRTPDSQRHALMSHAGADSIAAWRRGEPVTAAQFLGDVLRTASALPDARNVLNVCADRYRFAVALLAAVLRGQTTLLPPSTTPNVIRGMREFAPDVYLVSDEPQAGLDLPHFELPALGAAPAPFDVPAIDAAQIAACVFTSGSTGEPQPHFKRWGSLVLDVAGEARRLGVGERHSILGTVPAQHMYGFESTVLLPLAAGAALTAERPFYPADIDRAIACVPAPRVLFTTPFHLRAWLESGDTARLEVIVSATAPLSVGLARQAEERTGARIFEVYGCTETGQIATRRPTQSAEWDAFEGVRVWLEGEQAMAGGAHVDHPTPLQDVIEVLGDGARFLLHGRSADMVNIAGKRNSLGYLNHQLTSIDGVADGAFFLPDDGDSDGVTRLMAFVVAPGLTVAQVVAQLRSRIDPAFLPRPVVLVDRLPRALTGKLPREALRTLAREAARRSRGGA